MLWIKQLRPTNSQLCWILLLFIFIDSVHSEQKTGSLQSRLETHSKNNLLTSCTQVGPLTCATQPIKDLQAGACTQLRNCLKGRQTDEQIIQQVIQCDTPVLSTASEISQVAMITAQLEVDGPPLHGAYLFMRSKEGWCPADQLLQPIWQHGGYCETQSQFSWKHENSKAILNVLSERICHLPLDQEEIAAGVSDIALTECWHTQYKVTENRLKKLSEIESEKSCLTR